MICLMLFVCCGQCYYLCRVCVCVRVVVVLILFVVFVCFCVVVVCCYCVAFVVGVVFGLWCVYDFPIH